MPVVLLINPNTSQASTAMMHRLFVQALPAGIEVQSATAARGVPMITTEAALAVAVDEVIDIGRARAAAVDAIVIAAFGNPGLAELRASVAIPVIGIGAAALLEAGAGGRRFGVATTTPGLDASIARTVDALGLGAAFTGTRIPAGDPLALASDPALQTTRLGEAVQACLADGAKAVVIGGGPLSEAAASLAPRFEVPVISAVAAAARAVTALLGATSPGGIP